MDVREIDSSIKEAEHFEDVPDPLVHTQVSKPVERESMSSDPAAQTEESLSADEADAKKRKRVSPAHTDSKDFVPADILYLAFADPDPVEELDDEPNQ